MTLTVGSLCSGYGGLEFGLAEVLDIETVWHVEYDKAPSMILDAHWPDVPNYGDVKTTDWHSVEQVDIVTAGYPCQPFSIAGKQEGINDPRHLWPAIADAVGVLRPHYLLLENVRNHLRIGFDVVLADLARLGYDARWTVVRASDAGAPHQRARLFVLAQNTDCTTGDKWRFATPSQTKSRRPRTDVGGRDRTPLTDTGCSCFERRRESEQLASSPRTNQSAGDQRQRHGNSAVDCGSVTADANYTRSQRNEPAGRCDLPAGRTETTANASSDGWDERRPESAWQQGRPSTSSGCSINCAVERDWKTAEGVDYGPAVRRWHDLTRCVPQPTEPTGRDGAHRLSPRFEEWMMGLAHGWVTDVDIPRNAQMKALGNGVVPQQASLAITTLLEVAA